MIIGRYIHQRPSELELNIHTIHEGTASTYQSILLLLFLAVGEVPSRGV